MNDEVPVLQARHSPEQRAEFLNSFQTGFFLFLLFIAVDTPVGGMEGKGQQGAGQQTPRPGPF